MAQLETRLKNLSPEKRKLLAVLQASRQDRNGSIPRIDRQGELPLSYAQERLWFLDQLVPNNAFYNIPFVLRLKGVLDVEALERTLNQIVQRHEALRTRFKMQDGRGVQVIDPEWGQRIEIADLSEWADEERETAAMQLVREGTSRPFNLAEGPLFRAKLVRLSELEHLLVITMHHIVSDIWSLGVLVKEVAALYDAFAQGKESPLPKLSIQYADYAVWQRQWLQGQVLDQQLSYWKQQLEGVPVLQLPTDRPRPPMLSYEGGMTIALLSEELSAGLKELSQREGATLFMTMLTGFQVVLHRYSGQQDIVVGSPIANRNRAEIEPLIGFFVNTLALRTKLTGDESLREVMEKVKEMCFGAYGHQDLPFEKLVEQMQPERDLSRNPLVQVVFAVQNTPGSGLQLDLPGLQVEMLVSDTVATRFDQEWYVYDQGRKLQVMVFYSTDLYEARTVEQMMRHWQRVLQQMVSDLSQPISRLSLLSQAERQQLLVDCNATAEEFPHQLCVHELFEQQAIRAPQNIAVKYEGQEVSYAELNARANRLAHYLRGKGVGPEVRVGICMDRSVEMVVGLMGILKAGGGYVPMEGSYPAERLKYMVEDAGVGIVVTDGEHAREVERWGVRVVDVEVEKEKIKEEREEEVGVEVRGENVAYVIYTSGSTGKPKGVMSIHSGLLNRLMWMQAEYVLEDSDRVLQKTPFTFDVSVWEFFWPLITGACLVVARPGGHRENNYLVEYIKQNGVTTTHFVPSMLQYFLEEQGVENCQSLRRVICSGEALSSEIAHRFHEKLGAELHNLYGPTEASIDVTYWRCEPGKVGRVVPIGQPIANTQMYVLDKYMEPVPVGVASELFIGGTGLARGYLNRPDLTADRFLPDPFATIAGSRLYRTGDHARWTADGVLEFIGRIDDQVKIRGHRIELGEIEAALCEHADVGAATVLVRQDNDDKRLVAYVVPREVGQAPAGQWQDERLSQWQSVFDRTYRDGQAPQQAAFNIAGWESSYTGLPLTEAEMREWVELTVERIRRLKPRRVLEIGCGTGLLLLRLAGECESYIGTDFSAEALNYVEQQLSQQAWEGRVKLLQRMANEFEGLEQEGIDTVVINSVAQYFPTLSYLEEVISKAVKVVGGSGTIFIGDVRSLPLLEAFHTAVVMKNAEQGWEVGEVGKQVRRRMSQEKELVIDPRMFMTMRERHTEIGGVSIQPKRGEYDNELTQFRYDVMIKVGRVERVEVEWEQWEAGEWSDERVREELRKPGGGRKGLRGVSNERVEEAVRMAKKVREEEEGEKVEEVMKRLQVEESEEVMEVDEWWSIGEEEGYEVEVSWCRGGEEGRYDVVYEKRGEMEGEWEPGRYKIGEEEGEEEGERKYANNPMRGKWGEEKIPELREHVKKRLPEYMVPGAYVVMERLPLTPNGKLDKKALPPPDTSRPYLAKEFVSPQGHAQELLADIWQRVLNLEKVGIQDNFFELGGDSIHTIQVVARANEAGMKLTTREMFKFQTIAELAELAGSNTQALFAQTSTKPQREQRTNEETLFPSDFLLSGIEREKLREIIGTSGDIQDVFPLAPGAEHMFLKHLAQPENGTPLIQMLSPTQVDQFDVSRLERAWQLMVDRHSALKTSFVWGQLNRPLQAVRKAVTFGLDYRDWRGLTAVEQEKRLVAYLLEDRVRGFDFSAPHPIRMLVAQLRDNQFQTLLSFNYAMMDGWSLSIVYNELAQCYEALGSGRDIELPAPVPYENYLAWISEQDLFGAQQFWTKKLQAAGRPTPLMEQAPEFFGGTLTHLKRMASNVFGQAGYPGRIGSQYALLSPEATRGLQAIVKQHHLTMSTVANGAWAAVLSRITGDEEVVFGMASSGRPPQLAGIENIVGRTLNPLPLRVNLSRRSLPVVTWLRKLQEHQVELRQYEYVGLTAIQEWAGASHDRPLFESYVVFQNLTNLEFLAKKGWSTQKADILHHTALYIQDVHPIRIDIHPVDPILVTVSYMTQFFDSSTIGCILDLYVASLEYIGLHPKCGLSELFSIALS